MAKILLKQKNSLPFEASCNLELKISGYKDSEIEKLLDIKHEELLENYRIIKRFILFKAVCLMN